MHINRMHHVAIICSDYEVSKVFYTEVLGFKIIKETYRSDRNSYKLDLSVAGGGQIELFSFSDPPKRPSYPEARGLRHLAFEVKDIEVSIKHLIKHGVKVEPIRIDPLTQQRFTFFNDPDNLPLELYENISV